MEKEYLGCLIGDTDGDTFHVIGWVPAHDMKRFQFAVTGSCDSVPGAIGSKKQRSSFVKEDVQGQP